MKTETAQAKRSFIFNRWRTYARFGLGPIFLLFSVLDYFYQPQIFFKWAMFRLAYLLAVVVIFQLLLIYKTMRNQISKLAIGVSIAVCLIIDCMIYDSGGANSLYITGLALTTLAANRLFRFSGQRSNLVQGFSYSGALLAFILKYEPQDLRAFIVQSGFLIGLYVVYRIGDSSEYSFEEKQSKNRKILSLELNHLRRTEILKNHFPAQIRVEFEKNPKHMLERKLVNNAVVGFADMVSSSKISNELPLEADWSLKERFLEAATKRAIELNMVVLSHTGDGFMFLANFMNDEAWEISLVQFFEVLVSDYQKIWAELGKSISHIESGLKFGVSSGPILVGFIGHNQSYFTAVGPDVNLAARLCAQAERNEIVIGSRVWYSLKPLLTGWSYKSKVHYDLKGFSKGVAAVHISTRVRQEISA